jgi:hypothetical protein
MKARYLAQAYQIAIEEMKIWNDCCRKAINDKKLALWWRHHTESDLAVSGLSYLLCWLPTIYSITSITLVLSLTPQHTYAPPSHVHTSHSTSVCAKLHIVKPGNISCGHTAS